MASKKSLSYFVGLALAIWGTLQLLHVFGLIRNYQNWWQPIILVIIGLLVVLNTRGAVKTVGIITMFYGIILLLMTLGLFSFPFFWKIFPVTWLLLGLILIL